MKYQYEIPPKLVKKNGFFGTISNYDIGMSVLLADRLSGNADISESVWDVVVTDLRSSSLSVVHLPG